MLRLAGIQPLPRFAARALGLTAAVLALMAGRPAVSRAQTLTIPEYRELLLSKESTLARLDRELVGANARLDRLLAEKAEAGSPRGLRSRELSAAIVEVSVEIGELERQRRAARADQQVLRQALNERYSAAIDENLQHLGTVGQSDPTYGELLTQTGRYITSRDSLRVQIRIGESLGSFRDFPILVSDGPEEIREKAGFYRDYVHDVRAMVRALDLEIDQIRERERVEGRMQELQEDLAFQGEDVPKRPADDAGGDIREDPAISAGPGEPATFGGTPQQRIAALEEEKRPLELLRAQFEAKVREYEQRARTIYSRQTSPPAEENQ